MRIKPKKYDVLVFDAETDGLLDQVTRVHCIVVQDAATGQVWKFRRNKRENTIEKVFALLDDANVIVGHNIVAYDIPMLEYLYGWQPQALIRDTLVLSRLLFPDQKDKDFRLFEQGKLDGKLIGTHKLEAWGQRLGMFKGEYSKIREQEALAKGILPGTDAMRLYVWGTWTEAMEEYCEGDVAVTVLLWGMLQAREQAPEAVYVQHRLADLMARQQDNGFMFDTESAQVLADQLVVERERLCVQLEREFPGRFIPKKRMATPPVGPCAAAECDFPDFGITDDDVDTIRMWGVPERRKNHSPKWKEPTQAWYLEGSWATPFVWQEFNPRSRPQITDRLQEMGWEPEDEDYTEKGNVKANDVILRRICERYPVAEVLADLMALNKLMGQLSDGTQAWLKVVDANGFIHGYCNPCGAVTTRATHSFPNIAQIPAVKSKKVLISDLSPPDPNYVGLIKPTAMWKGVPVLAKEGWEGFEPDSQTVVKLLGLRGGWGIESRSLFVVPEGFTLVGSDLAGIELRCLAHRMATYDGGAYGRVLLEGDIHSENQKMAELDSRDTAKTFIYAFLYGAGDEKIGSIVDPLAPPHVQARIGKELKARFLRNLPALNKVIRDIQRQANRKFIVGIDGRRLFVRAKHAALNTDLQGMGATIANWWLIFIEDLLTEAGYEYGWNADYVFCAWVHDEVQIAARDEIAQEVRRICIEAAELAGKHLNFALPVEASAVTGYNWMMTH